MSKEKVFKDFDSMMRALDGVKSSEIESFKLKDKELAKQFKKIAEDHGDYMYIMACYPNTPICDALVEEYNLQVITHCIHDGDDSTSFSYSTGHSFVNREGWVFARVHKSAFCEEVEEVEEIEEDEDEDN